MDPARAAHPRLRANLERRFVEPLPTLPDLAGLAGRWREGREVRFVLFGACPNDASAAERFRATLRLMKHRVRPWLHCFENEALFVMADANESYVWATSTDAAVRALRAGNPAGVRLRPRSRTVRTLPDAPPEPVLPRSSDGVEVNRVGEALEQTMTWLAGTQRALIVGPAAALADPRAATLPLSPRGQAHALSHVTLLERAAPTPHDSAALEQALGAAMAAQLLALDAAWGRLAGDVRGPFFQPRGEREVLELWEATSFRTARDEACAGDASRGLLRLHWADVFRPGELAAYLDERGRFWAQDYGSREDWLLLAEDARVYVERLVRALSCTWAPRGQHRRATEQAPGLHGRAWADAWGCVEAPEACDAVMRLWESDDQLVVEDAFSLETMRWALDE